MKEILLVNTGGTFSKIYDPVKGYLYIDKEQKALKDIMDKWMCNIKIIDIIQKDSLEMTQEDMDLLLDTIKNASASYIVVVHGTDTMDRSCRYISKHIADKRVVFTGAMVPYSIDPVEATANLCSAYGYLMAQDKEGIYIAMHGKIENYTRVKKNKTKGYFEYDV